MNTISKTITGIFGMICLFASNSLTAQVNNVFAVEQQDARIYVEMFYQYDNNAFGNLTQDFKINVYNRTNDKLHIYIEYYADLTCGKRKTYQLGPLGDGYILQPNDRIDKTWGNDGINAYVRLLGNNECSKDSWKQTGVDKDGAKTYSIINSLGYRVVKIINLSEQERKEAEEKKKKEAETKNQQTTSKKEPSNKDAFTETSADFWGNTSSSSKKSTTSNNNNKDLYPKDENFVADSKFKNNLNAIKEGEYFTDGAGGYYKKELGGARKVDKMVYEREAANKIYEKMERQEAERQQRDAEFKQNWDNMSISFYAMSAAKEGMRDAKDLGSGYSSIEELNAAFNQKMRQVSAMGSQMQASTNQAIQAYSNIISTGSSGYDYSGYINAIGTIASAISANKAEKDAREELKRQRAEEEARIKKAQLDALVAIRTEIGKVYTEGGMPLSTHKITAPILYVFAYNSNKADWDKNQNVAMSISNVIPVYRYSDGTYPYTSNVKRTFENAGISNPVLMGYFTNKSEAENYRSSLLEVAPNAKFAVKEVEVKVKEQKPNTTTNTSETDFWEQKPKLKNKTIPKTPKPTFGVHQQKIKKQNLKRKQKKKLTFGVSKRLCRMSS